MTIPLLGGRSHSPWNHTIAGRTVYPGLEGGAEVYIDVAQLIRQIRCLGFRLPSSPMIVHTSRPPTPATCWQTHEAVTPLTMRASEQIPTSILARGALSRRANPSCGTRDDGDDADKGDGNDDDDDGDGDDDDADGDVVDDDDGDDDDDSDDDDYDDDDVVVDR